jgi:transcriptional regulator with XRE-family HTH domain
LDLTEGERLLIYRLTEGLTQQKFAESWQIHQTYVAAMERGSRPVRPDIAKWTDKLPLSIPAHIMLTVLRKRKGFGKHRVAALTGIDAREVGKMERGLVPIDHRIEDLLNS